jgi:glucan biosynthesis protein C
MGVEDSADRLVESRRYDIDWLRVIAIGLLLVYHIAIVFQPWAPFIGFPVSEEPLESIWPFMELLNVWRIPLLFVVSGMGVFFAIRRRSWRQLLAERSKRILLPFIFGFFAVVPLHVLVLLRFYGEDPQYVPNQGHLWFLANIFLYVLLLSPTFFLLKGHPDNFLFVALRRLLAVPGGIYVFVLPFVLEVLLIKPDRFAYYLPPSFGDGMPGFEAYHGLLLGFVAFFVGFLLVALGEVSWRALEGSRYVSLALALWLFLMRWFVFHFDEMPDIMRPVESMMWILVVLGFGYRHLNRSSPALAYLSQAAYPVYIVHMGFLYVAAFFVLRTEIPAPLGFLVVIILTFGGCLASFELLRRVGFLRPLFGLNPKRPGNL